MSRIVKDVIKQEMRKILVEKKTMASFRFPLVNSAGLPIYPTEEGIRNFWKWFDRSYVIDRDGRPLVMYHGTRKQNIEVFYSMSHFGTSRAANNRLLSLVFDELDDPELDHRLKKVYSGFNVMPVYLSIQNPLRMHDYEDWYDLSLVTDRLLDRSLTRKQVDYIVRKATEHDKKIDVGEIPERSTKLSHFFPMMTFLKKELAKNGYDGIIYQNQYEDIGKDSYIVFSPKQIKSAIGNKGTFSTTSKNILESSQI